MIDSKQQRLNMVESQVRPSDVTDRRIIKAMLEVPREAFLPQELRALAYMDEAVPVRRDAGRAEARYLLPPRIFAKLVQLAEVAPEAVVLDVGCASGYSTAVLARLAKSVVAVESDAALATTAAATLRELGVSNAMVVPGPLGAGAPDRGPFAAILLNGAVPEVPQSLLDQLAEGGRLVAVIGGQGSLGCAQVWQRAGTTFDARAAFDAGAQPLPGFARETGFVF
jgi:protein-L-isoaspartate(D-aspartate) O-methyltransferase